MQAAPGVPALRPMTFADLFDEGFSLYRRNWKHFGIVAGVVLVPTSLLQTILPPVLGATMGPSAQAVATIGAVLLSSVAGLLSYAASIRAIAATRLGRPISVGEAYSTGGGLVWRMFVATLVVAVVVGLLLVTLVGWIWLGVLWSQYLEVLVLERTGVLKSLGRSRALVRGSWWRVFAFLIVSAILSGIVYLVVGGIGTFVFTIVFTVAGFGPSSAPVVAVTAFFTVLSQVVASPIAYCLSVLLYFDLRVRKEGLDLEIRSDRLAAAGA